MYFGIHSFRKYQQRLIVIATRTSIQNAGCRKNARPQPLTVSRQVPTATEVTIEWAGVPRRVVKAHKAIQNTPTAPTMKNAQRQPQRIAIGVMITGAISEPMAAPLLKVPLARPRSVGGSMSATI